MITYDQAWIIAKDYIKPQDDSLRQTEPGDELVLEPVCKIGKEENRSNGDHRREIGGSFFIASGNATKLFETIDEPFNDIPLSVLLFVE